MREFNAHVPRTFLEWDEAAVHEGEPGGLEEARLLRPPGGFQLAPFPLSFNLLNRNKDKPEAKFMNVHQHTTHTAKFLSTKGL